MVWLQHESLYYGKIWSMRSKLRSHCGELKIFYDKAATMIADHNLKPLKSVMIEKQSSERSGENKDRCHHINVLCPFDIYLYYSFFNSC